ncbi:MAG: redoxin family protein [Planctomycetaceae bacterium]
MQRIADERTTRRRYLLGGLLGFLLLVGVVLWRTGNAAEKNTLAETFRKVDADADGKVTRAELQDDALFDKLDLNTDQSITLHEARQAVATGVLDLSDAKATPSTSAPSAKTTPTPATTTADSPLIRDVRQGPRQLTPAEHGVGRCLPDVTFTDIAGKTHKLSDLLGKSGLVIAMTSTSCPLSQKYLPTLVKVSKQHAAQGVPVMLINSVATDSIADMQKAAGHFGTPATYVFDPEHKLAQAIGATATTDVLLVDRRRTVTYHGAIDDQYGFGYSKNEPRNRYLADAIDALLHQREPVIAATDAPGCAIDHPATEKTDSEITYHNRISRLMQTHCVECHRQGGVAPFALASYAEVVAHAPMVREVLRGGTMPPWFSTPSPHGSLSPWVNDRSLAEVDKADLLAWLDSNHPIGDERDAPVPRQFPQEWNIGTPDAVFQFEKPISVIATGTMPYQYVTVKTDLPDDKWIQAIEIQPENRAVVHHVLVFVKRERMKGEETDANGLTRAERDERGGFFAAYVPGNSFAVFPEGYGKHLPKNATLIFQMHYTPNGTATTDNTRIAFRFASQPPQHEIKVHGLANHRISIPPQADNHPEKAELRLPGDVDILAYMPHMHLRGKSARYELVRKDGAVETLLDIPRYDFNWQLKYQLREPLRVKKGETIRFTGHFDNSADNPANPDPDSTIKWGPQTDDEMLLGYLEYVVPTNISGGLVDDSKPEQPAPGITALFKAMDRDMDGRLSREELPRSRIFDRLDKNNDDFLSLEEAQSLSR